MKKSEIKLVVMEIVMLSILFLNFFIKNILDQKKLILLIILFILITSKTVGYERSRKLQNKKVIILVALYSISFLVLIYGLGLFTGYQNNSYSMALWSIVNNVTPVVILILTTEILRYEICKKGENNKLVLSIAVILFTLIDVVMLLHLYDTNELGDLIKLLTVVVVPSLSKNYILCNWSKKYGFVANMVYEAVFGLYEYVMPILPNLGDYLESVCFFLIPIMMKYIIKDGMCENEEEDVRDKKKRIIITRVVGSVSTIVILIIIGLCSNIMPYWIAAVGSGSMDPTIKVGDAVIVDKTITNHIEKLKVGEVIVFRVKDSIYTHRIVEKNEENGTYVIKTKGDREGNVVDDWVVTNSDIIGVVRFKISYIGYPTVLLNRLIKESKS